MTITTEQALAIGGKSWTSRDGRITRVYIDIRIVARLLDLQVDYYRSGNIAAATIAGQDISNAEAGRILTGTKIYVADGEVHVQTTSRHEDDIRAAVIAEIQRVAEPETDDDDTPTPTAAEQVTALRTTGRTVREIAQMIGVAVSTIYRWARGVCRPRPANAAALAALVA